MKAQAFRDWIRALSKLTARFEQAEEACLTTGRLDQFKDGVLTCSRT